LSGYASGLKTYAAGEVVWIYPHEETPPRGVKLHILQEGGISIQSQWYDGEGYMAFQRMFKRDHEKEAEYKQFLLMGMKKR